MKVLLVEDDDCIIEAFKKAAAEINVSVVSFEPAWLGNEKICAQLEELCREENFDVALLDSRLWFPITGTLFVALFFMIDLPFIAFSNSDYDNQVLKNTGAIMSVNKIDFMTSCKDNLMGLLKEFSDLKKIGA